MKDYNSKISSIFLMAIKAGNLHLCEKTNFIKNPEAIFEKDEEGNTALCYLVCHEQLKELPEEIWEKIIPRLATTKGEKEGESIYHIIVLRNTGKKFADTTPKRILEQFKKIEILTLPDEKGTQPIHLFAAKGKLEELDPQILQENLIFLLGNRVNKKGHNALHYAASYEKIAKIPPQAFIPEIIDQVSIKGQSPFHFSAIEGSFEGWPKKLLTPQRLLRTPDHQGKSPLDILNLKKEKQGLRSVPIPILAAYQPKESHQELFKEYLRNDPKLAKEILKYKTQQRIRNQTQNFQVPN